MRELLDELRKLDLPEGSYAIFGSGPMVVRGLREAGDLDIVVKKKVWDQLAEEFGVKDEQKGQIMANGIDIFWNWEPWLHDPDLLINTAEMIDGFPYVRLEHLLEWKKAFGREKDLKDVRILEDYLANVNKK
tara:strand:+ start:430 stop:825 length:396 start_codon:yes stop_codon:yes gene_type:complete